jgi:hypothetical protein
MSISFIHSHVNVMFTTQNITTPRAMQLIHTYLKPH